MVSIAVAGVVSRLLGSPGLGGGAVGGRNAHSVSRERLLDSVISEPVQINFERQLIKVIVSSGDERRVTIVGERNSLCIGK